VQELVLVLVLEQVQVQEQVLVLEQELELVLGQVRNIDSSQIRIHKVHIEC